MSPRSRSIGSRSAGMGGGSYAYDDPNDEDEEDLLDDDDELEELDDEEEDYNGYRTMARARARGDAHSRSRSRSLSRSRTGRGMGMGRMQSMQSPYARSHQSPYGRTQSPYAREMMEPDDYDELDEEEEMELMSERGRPGVDMYAQSPRYQGHHRFAGQYRPHRGYARMHSPYMPGRYARDDLAMYDDMPPYGAYSPAAALRPYPQNYMDYMPRKYYDDLDMLPWGGMAPSINQAYWNGASAMSMRRVMSSMPGQLPNIKYATPRAFNVSISSLAGTSGPWFTLIDELTNQRILFANGACTQGISVISLLTEISGIASEVLRLTSCRTGRSVGCADVRIVVSNAYAIPLITAIVPGVMATCERQQMSNFSNFYNSYGGGAGLYGAAYPGALPSSAAAAAVHAARGGFGTPTMSPYGGGMGWYGASPYGYDDPTGMYGGFPSMSEFGAVDPRIGALFYTGDRGHESPSPYQRRKRVIPTMRLVRAVDGTREWLQTAVGHEMAGVAYSTPPGTPAPFSIEGGQIRMVLQPGVDLTLVAAALIARLWIYVETGIGQ